jgi:hypothetical protein
MGDERFSYSTDGGEYYHGDFPTREEALAEAREDAPGRKAWTGVQVPFSFMVDAAGVIDELRDRANDHAGDVSDDWLDRVPHSELDELGAVLTEAFVAWMDKHGHAPTFYGIQDVEVHPAPTPLPTEG